MALPPLTNGQVFSIKNKGNTVYIGGTFTTVAGNTGFYGLARYSLLTGAVDTGWKPSITTAGTVNCFEFSPDGNFIFVGSTGGARLYKIALSNGAISSFAVVNNSVESMRFDGNKLYVAGQFTQAIEFQGSPVARTYVCKFDITGNSNLGSLDSSFAPTFSAPIYALEVASDGVYLGGAFTSFSTSHNRIVKLQKSNGAVVSGWGTGTGPNNTVRKILLGSDGSVFVAGAFTSWNSDTSVGDYLVKLTTSGSRIATFDTGSTLGSGGTTRDLIELDGCLYFTKGRDLTNGCIIKSTGLATWQVDTAFDCKNRISTSVTSYIVRALHWDGVNLHVGLEYSSGGSTPTYDGNSGWSWTINKATGEIADLQSDTVSPTVTVSSGSIASGTTTALNSIPMTVTFSENVTGFSAADIFVIGGSVTNFSGNGSSYSFTFASIGDGSKSIAVPPSVCQDVIGNLNLLSNYFEFTVQTAQPVVTMPSSTVAKKAILNVTASRNQIQTTAAVAQGSWKRALLVWKSGATKVACMFKPNAANPTAKFRANVNQPGSFTLDTIIVVKNDNKSVIINRASIQSAEQYDISVT